MVSGASILRCAPPGKNTFSPTLHASSRVRFDSSQLEERFADERLIVWLKLLAWRWMSLPPPAAALLGNLSITARLMHLIKPPVLQPHPITSCPFIGVIIISWRILKNARLPIFPPFLLSISSTSKSALRGTFSLSLCPTAFLPHVKMSAPAWHGEVTYQQVKGRRHIASRLCADVAGGSRGLPWLRSPR